MAAIDDLISGYEPPPSYPRGRLGGSRRFSPASALEDDSEASALLESLAPPPEPSRRVDPDSASFHTQAREKSALANAWDTVTRPVKVVVGATQGLLPKVLAGGTGAYARAREEEAQGRFGKPASALTTAEALEAAPGAGDVLAQVVPEGWRESTVGRVLGPLGRLGGNIFGDLTTYLGGVGAVTKVGKATKALGAVERELELATKLGDAAARASLAPRVVEAMSALGEASAASGRGERLLDFLASTQHSGEVARGVRQFLRGEPIGAARAALSLPTSAYTGLAYAPEMVEGIASGAEETARQAQQGNYGAAAASGAGTLLQTGLAYLVGRGIIHEKDALATLHAEAVKQRGGEVGPEAEAPAPEAPVEAAPPAEPPVTYAPREPLLLPEPRPGPTRFVVTPDGEVVPVELEQAARAELGNAQREAFEPKGGFTRGAANPLAPEGQPGDLEAALRAALATREGVLEAGAPRLTGEPAPPAEALGTGPPRLAPRAQEPPPAAPEPAPAPTAPEPAAETVPTPPSAQEPPATPAVVPEPQSQAPPDLAAEVAPLVRQAKASGRSDDEIIQAMRPVLEERGLPVDWLPGVVAETQVTVPDGQRRTPALSKGVAGRETPGPEPTAPEDLEATLARSLEGAKEPPPPELAAPQEAAAPDEEVWLRLNDAREALAHKVPNEDALSAAMIKLGEQALEGKLPAGYAEHFMGERTPEKMDAIRGLLYRQSTFKTKDALRAEAREPTGSRAAPLDVTGGEVAEEGAPQRLRIEDRSARPAEIPEEPRAAAPPLGALAPEASPEAQAAAGQALTIEEIQSRLQAARKSQSPSERARGIRERVAAMEAGTTDQSLPQQLAELVHMTEGRERPFGKTEDPRLAYVRRLAAELDATPAKGKPSLSSLVDAIIGKTGQGTQYRAALAAEAQRRLDAVVKPGERLPVDFKVTPGVDEAALQAKSAEWSRAIDSAPMIPGSKLRAVSLDGGDPQALAAASTRLVPSLSSVQSDLSRRFGWTGELSGVTDAGAIAGVRVGERILVNPVEAWATAEGDAYKAGRNVLDSLLHEHLHEQFGHGPEMQNAYADAVLSLAKDYVAMSRRLANGFEGSRFEPLRPDWETRRSQYVSPIAERAAAVEGAPGGLPPGAVEGGGAQGEPVAGGALGPGPGLPEGGGGPGAPVPEGAGAGPAPRVIRPIAPPGGGPPSGPGGARGERGPGTPLGGRPDEGAGGGPRAGEGAGEAPRVQAALTPEVAKAEAARAKREATLASMNDFIETYRDLVKDDPKARAMLDQVRDAVSKAPEETIEKWANAGPAPKPGGIAFSVQNLPDTLGPRGKAEVAVILALRNHLLDRSKSATFESMSAQARNIFQVHSPEAFMAAKKSGRLPRTVADSAAFKQLIGLYDREIADRFGGIQQVASLPEGPNKSAQLELATTRMHQAQLARLEAIEGLANTGTFFGRGLALMGAAQQPLRGGETFYGRMRGALKRMGAKADVADRFVDLLEKETADPMLADWNKIEDAWSTVLRPKLSDKVIEFWKAGLLGWPTQIANVASNVGMWGMRNVEEAVSALVQHGPKSAAHEVAGRFMGLRQALRELLQPDGPFALLPAIGDALAAKKPSIKNVLEHGQRFDEVSLGSLKGAIGGRFGEFVRTPFKLLSELDNAFKHVSRMQTYGQEAGRLAQEVGERGRREGESLAHARQRIFNEMLTVARNKSGNPEKFADWAPFFRKADASMNRDTFQAPTGPFAEAGRQLSARRDLPGIVSNFIVPFWKTPANVLKEGIYRTPLGMYRLLREGLKMKAGAEGAWSKPELVSEAVKTSLGSLVMLELLHSGLEGSITGSGPTDPKQQELLKESGWQPYSFRFPGGHYYSYQRLEPLSTVLGIAADAAEGVKRGDFSNWQDAVKRLAASVTTNLTNKTFLSGLEGAVNAVSDPFRYGPTYIKQLEASLVPNIVGSVPVGGLARALDPTFRQTEVGAGPILAKTPGLSKLLPPQRTPLGEERTRPGEWWERLFSPLVRSEEKEGPVADVARELDRIGFSPSAIPAYGVFSGQRVYYTREEQEQMAQAERRGVLALASVIKSPGFQALPDKESLATQGLKTKEDVAREVIRAYRTPVVQLSNRRALERAKRGVYRPEPLLGAS